MSFGCSVMSVAIWLDWSCGVCLYIWDRFRHVCKVGLCV